MTAELWLAYFAVFMLLLLAVFLLLLSFWLLWSAISKENTDPLDKLVSAFCGTFVFGFSVFLLGLAYFPLTGGAA
jgi:hypothetical protein